MKHISLGKFSLNNSDEQNLDQGFEFQVTVFRNLPLSGMLELPVLISSRFKLLILVVFAIFVLARSSFLFSRSWEIFFRSWKEISKLVFFIKLFKIELTSTCLKASCRIARFDVFFFSSSFNSNCCFKFTKHVFRWARRDFSDWLCWSRVLWNIGFVNF